MNSIKFVLTIIFFIGALPLQAIYLVDRPEAPVKLEEISGQNDKFPEICKIEKYSGADHGGTGTGTFVAPNIVLTARHVVESRDDTESVRFWETKEECSYQEPDPKSIQIKIGNKKVGVKSVHVFGEGDNRGRLDMALLVLENPVKEITPRKVRAVAEGEALNTITMAGYGSGRVICDWKSYSKARRNFMERKVFDDFNVSFYRAVEAGGKVENIFRFREGIVGNFKVEKRNEARTFELSQKLEALKEGKTLQTSTPYHSPYHINVMSKYIRADSGDSGGPLLDGQGNIVATLAHAPKEFGIKESDARVKAAAVTGATDNGMALKEWGQVLLFIYRTKVLRVSGNVLGFGQGEVYVWNWLKNRFGANHAEHLYTQYLLNDNPFKSMCIAKIRQKNAKIYASEIQKRDEEILEMLFGEKDINFSSSYFCIYPAVKEWIDQVIDQHRFDSVDDVEDESSISVSDDDVSLLKK